mgnify:CR=1 FL=1
MIPGNDNTPPTNREECEEKILELLREKPPEECMEDLTSLLAKMNSN